MLSYEGWLNGISATGVVILSIVSWDALVDSYTFKLLKDKSNW